MTDEQMADYMVGFADMVEEGKAESSWEDAMSYIQGEYRPLNGSR